MEGFYVYGSLLQKGKQWLIRHQIAVKGSLAALTVGCMFSWPSPTLKKLRQPDSPVHLTSYEEGWVVSAMFFGQLLGPFPSQFVMHKLGPKRGLFILGAFPVSSWILVYLSTSTAMLVTARLLAGFWFGATLTLVPIYTAEISEPHLRGVFGCFVALNITIGSKFAFIVGPFVTFKAMSVIGGCLPVLFLALFSLCPESPYYYIVQKRVESAARSLYWLRGGASEQTKLELELIQVSVEETKNDDKCLQKLKTLMTVPANRKAFIIVGILQSLSQLCGLSCLTAFSSVILPPRLGPLTSDDCMIIVTFVPVLPVLFAMVLVQRVGRRPLLLFSSVGVCLSMFWTGAWHFLNSKTTVDVSYLNWLPLAGYVVFYATNVMGLASMVPIYQGELFRSDIKGMASALSTMISALTSAIASTLFPVISENIGIYMNLFIFSAAGLASALFTCFYVIETEGKSLQIIQAELNDGKMERVVEVGETRRLLT